MVDLAGVVYLTAHSVDDVAQHTVHVAWKKRVLVHLGVSKHVHKGQNEKEIAGLTKGRVHR